jgi:hypothetical protein
MAWADKASEAGRVTIDLGKEIHAELRALAERRNLTLTAFLRSVLQDYAAVGRAGWTLPQMMEQAVTGRQLLEAVCEGLAKGVLMDKIEAAGLDPSR